MLSLSVLISTPWKKGRRREGLTGVLILLAVFRVRADARSNSLPAEMRPAELRVPHSLLGTTQLALLLLLCEDEEVAGEGELQDTSQRVSGSKAGK